MPLLTSFERTTLLIISDTFQQHLGNTTKMMASNYIQPTGIDILCGRGKANATHPGNIYFTQLMQANLQKYQDGPRRIDRTIIVTSLVDQLLLGGSRFLKKDKATNQWIQLDSLQCHEKVGHALRDLVRKEKRKNQNKTARVATTNLSISRHESAPKKRRMTFKTCVPSDVPSSDSTLDTMAKTISCPNEPLSPIDLNEKRCFDLLSSTMQNALSVITEPPETFEDSYDNIMNVLSADFDDILNREDLSGESVSNFEF